MEENINQIQQASGQSPVPVAVEPKPARNWLKISLVVILLLVLGAGLVFAGTKIGEKRSSPVPTTTPAISEPTPTPDPTVGWKTYVNTIHHYSFKYPNSWFSTDCNNKNLFLLHSTGVPSCIDISGGEIAFVVNNKDKQTYVEDYIIGKELLLQNSTLGGKANKYYLKDQNNNILPPILYTILLGEGNKLNVLVFKKIDEPIFDQILSTFKFLPTDETANWETYTNTEYGFSFKHPGEWNVNVPSFEGKHESNKTILRVDVTNNLDFKNAALLGNRKDVLNISISVWDNENVKSFQSVIAEWDNFFQHPKPSSTSVKEINQILWTRRELVNASNLPIVEFIAQKGKYLYVVEISPRDSTLIDFADQILSTFKFLD